MAIIVYGAKCRICGEPKLSGQQLVSFDPFVSNRLDPLWFFTDASFHKECFDAHPLAGQVHARLTEREHLLRQPYRCEVCKRSLEDPNDIFVVGHLTDNEADPLHKYNYKMLHRTHLHLWKDLREFYDLIGDLNSSGRWQGPTLAWMIGLVEPELSKGA